uniref:(California timema) hypothetical protein n=1 Tax=Timema californicum TaxID=61474 RepID=A0A7R9PAY3_TIMCA|nr:unnamed protein product [Timema californicum]
MSSGEPACIYTALCFFANESIKHNQKNTFVTFDQPIYIKAAEIVAGSSELSTAIVWLDHIHYAKSARLYLPQIFDIGCIMDKDDFEDYCSKGYFTIRRTNKFWCSVAVDLAIEKELIREIKTDGGLTRYGSVNRDKALEIGSECMQNMNGGTFEATKLKRKDRVTPLSATNNTMQELVLVITFLPPAPEKLLHLICCGCKKGCEGNCECKKSGLACFIMCRCLGEVCSNSPSSSISMNSEENYRKEDTYPIGKPVYRGNHGHRTAGIAIAHLKEGHAV